MIRYILIILLVLISGSPGAAQESKDSTWYTPIERNPFKKDGIYLSLHTGIAQDRMKPSGYLIDHLQFDRPRLLSLSAILDFDLADFDDDIKGFAKGWIFRMEIAYKPMNFKAEGQVNSQRYDKYELKGNTLYTGFSLLYGIPWRWKLRPYGGVGIGLSSANFRKNILTSYFKPGSFSSEIVIDYEPWETADPEGLTPVFTIGLLYGSRLDLNLKFSNGIWTRYDDPHHQLKSESTIISFGYRL